MQIKKKSRSARERENKTSSIQHFHSLCLVSLCWINFDSVNAMKILANDTAIFVPTAVPCIWRKFS